MTQEKRKYFRISDNIHLRFRMIDQGDLEQGITRLRAGVSRKQRMLDSLLSVDVRLTDLIGDLADEQPKIAAIFKLLNRKTHIMAQAIAEQSPHIESDDPIGPTHPVSLSANGLSFKSAESFNEGDLLELHLVLFPAVQSISAFGKVVDCRIDEPVVTGATYGVGVEYVYLAEGDLDFIVAHVLDNQSQQLRHSKSQGDK